MQPITTTKVWELLDEVRDPEIPVLSLVDLGVINGVTVANGRVRIDMTPTFVGCPALDMMRSDIRDRLLQHGITDVEIAVSFKVPWTSDRISEKGKVALRSFGLAPPPDRNLFTDLDVLPRATCPRCGNDNTELRNAFGPTLCRSIHYCNDCKEAFQQFKPL